MAGSPITLTLYDAQDEKVGEFTRTIIPWGILKRAVRLSKTMNKEDPSEEDMDALAGLVVEIFGNQFSVEDLDNGADVSEMVAVLTAIMSKANAVMPNPTRPAGK
jgi:hypothetical protein